MSKEITKFTSTDELKVVLAGQYQKQLNNIFGDEQRALEFLSNVVVSVQRTPKLLECTPNTVLSAFMSVAQLKFMPSDVSGEAYVIPYKNKGIMEANFQMGYQGYITLMYRAGITGLGAEVVRKKDNPKMKMGRFTYEVDPTLSEKERGDVVGVYAWATYNGGVIDKYMNIKDIEAHGKKFSKSYTTSYSPWKSAPEWMWKKTVILQLAKLLPKNDVLNKAIQMDQSGDTTLPPIQNGGVINTDKLKAGAPSLDANKENYEENKDNENTDLSDISPFTKSEKTKDSK